MAESAVQRRIICSVLQMNLLFISWTGVAAFALLLYHGMQFDFASASTAVGATVLLAPFAVVFRRRGIGPFANLLTGFLCMVAFSTVLSILTYAGTPLNAPLADDWLKSCDAMLGIHLPSIVEWMSHHEALKNVFDLAYPSVMISTLLALVVLGLNEDEWQLQAFVLQFMIAGIITTLFYFLLPAVAPVGSYNYSITPQQEGFLEHFLALRSGELRVVSLSRVEGLVTFPSFHTCWALLIAWGFRHNRWLRFPMLILNLAVAASTVTTGWHYASDVVGGIAVAIVSVLAINLLRPRLSHTGCLLPHLAATQDHASLDSVATA
jgi:membrane-associated phospholipid phosphatase